MDLHDARALLGVQAGDDLSQTRAAYRRRAQQLHPDRHAGGSDGRLALATVDMQMLNGAFELVVASLQSTAARPCRPGLSRSALACPTCDPAVIPGPRRRGLGGMTWTDLGDGLSIGRRSD